MYYYRKLSKWRQQEVLKYRKFLNLPLHEPPHYPDGGTNLYFITGANFNHVNIMSESNRKEEFLDKIIEIILPHYKIYAWCVMSNHYHLIIETELEHFGSLITRVYKRTALDWNKLDRTIGRKVWFRYSDRRIRSVRHFWVTVNYIHNNPRKHYRLCKLTDWPFSSIHNYLDVYGREKMIEIWGDYPVKEYGEKWDKF